MVEEAFEEDLEKIQRANQFYLIDFLTHLSYMSDLAWAKKAQNEWEDQQRKLKHGRP